jgi:hypothetical protein
MHCLEFLRGLHERLAPRTYLEIGVAQGHSLALSRCRSIGVDPAFTVDQHILAPVSLLRTTSDDYFAQLERVGARAFGKLPVDFAYVDGMHHFEYALRDFIGVERHSAPSTLVAFDDVLPRNAEEAAREPKALPWTGDVFRIVPALAEHRPDLLALVVATEPTGTLVVARLDPENRVLEQRLDEIVRHYVQPDPQSIPEEVLERTHAISPATALDLDNWEELRRSRV